MEQIKKSDHNYYFSIKNNVQVSQTCFKEEEKFVT
jgi:hypothetical protein